MAVFSNLRGQKLRTFQSKAAYLFGKSSAVFVEKERIFLGKSAYLFMGISTCSVGFFTKDNLILGLMLRLF